MAQALEIGSTLGGYRIAAVLGRGGMGVVYLAEQPTLGRRVAIKVIAPQLATNQDFRERFKRESRLAAAIEHANAVPVYEAGSTDDGTLYLVMRYVEGTDLKSLIECDHRLEPSRAAHVVVQVAGALDEAHAHGLVHRDIKPANILISSRRGVEHAYLTDFGLTKSIAGATGGLTATGQWVGTVNYVSPEQIEGKRVDARADVYALGCVLFEALTGRVPFKKESDVARLFAHLNEAPPDPGALTAGVSTELARVVIRALAKDPDERFPSAGDFGRAAVAAAVGREAATPERAVAAGAAAPVIARSAPPTLPSATVDAGEARRADLIRAAARQSKAKTGDQRPPPGVDRGRPASTPSRRLAWLSGAATLIVAAVAVALATGLIGGGGQDTDGESTVQTTSTGAGATTGDEPRDDDERPPDTGGLPFATIDAGAYKVEMPSGWILEGEVESPVEEDASLRLRTAMLSPDGDARVAINRRPDLDDSPEVQAREAMRKISGEPGYESLGSGSAKIGGRGSYSWVFDLMDEDLGVARAAVYFLSIGDAYRVQATAKLKQGSPTAPIGSIARHAAETLRT